MARHLISTTLLLIVALSAAAGFTLQNITRRESPGEDKAHERPTLYKAIVHLDGRPTEVLVDNLGDPEDLKFQTGDPVATPWPFIGGFGSVINHMLNFRHISDCGVELLFTSSFSYL